MRIAVVGSVSGSRAVGRASRCCVAHYSTFTDSVFADRVEFKPKAPPSRSATHMPQVKQRMREVKAQIREERYGPAACLACRPHALG